MALIKDRIEGDLVLEENTSIHGMVVGCVTVSPRVNLQLHGMIIGELLLLPRSEVFVHGMVNGKIINRGGSLRIFGQVNGKVLEEGGETIVAPNASIQGGDL